MSIEWKPNEDPTAHPTAEEVQHARAADAAALDNLVESATKGSSGEPKASDGEGNQEAGKGSQS